MAGGVVEGWTPLVVGHVVGAAAAMFLGAFNMFRPVRGDPTHKVIGYSWAALMYWVAISSFWIRDLNDGRFSWIHLLSILTLVTLSIGIQAAIRRNFRLHRRMMQGTYFGLLGAFIGAVAVPSRLVPQLVLHEPTLFAVGATVSLLTAALVVAGAFGFGRRTKRAG